LTAIKETFCPKYVKKGVLGETFCPFRARSGNFLLIFQLGLCYPFGEIKKRACWRQNKAPLAGLIKMVSKYKAPQLVLWLCSDF
jgi:hypothetical protein